MKQMHEVREKKNKNIVHVEFDISAIPSQDRKFSRLKNRSQIFEDRRFKKPKYKSNYHSGIG